MYIYMCAHIYMYMYIYIHENMHTYILHRPSIKGSKLLLKVIKAVIINIHIHTH